LSIEGFKKDNVTWPLVPCPFVVSKGGIKSSHKLKAYAGKGKLRCGASFVKGPANYFSNTQMTLFLCFDLRGALYKIQWQS
jgi:hypothetical protein